MAQSASGTVKLELILAAVNSLDLSVETRASLSKVFTQTWSSGTAVNSLDRLFVDERSVAGSGTDSLDLNGGGLTDVLGVTFAPARIKLLVVSNLGPNDIQVVRPSNGVAIFGAVGDFDQIPVSGLTYKSWPDATGKVVTAGTADLINIVNTAAGTIGYQIIIGGASA